ncbi:MAG: mechanosensitive ion channel family protein [Deltaproteobacteria bacterium]|nr:mechanosensitive ion channel family protein [Deltaproteobacteria bacterium]MDQ3297567.1 mechanosensitive ion channel family protein [Myxococcota bacterium]
MIEWIPAPLRVLGPWGLEYWQWLGIAIAIVIAVIAGRIAGRFVIWIAGRIATRTDATWDDDALLRLARPTRFLGKVLIARLLLPVLLLPASATSVIVNVLLAALGFGVIWGLVSVIDVIVSRLALQPWAVKRPASRALISLAGRTAKVLLLVIAAITFLGSFGLPVGSLIAGVGIGGIALAFGAQKTVENLFGAFAIGIDQPLREGDFVRTDADTLGTVEAVGLRSTRIRTLDRTIVSIPNGRLSESKIETFGERDRCRLHTVIGLVYSTTSKQMREVLDGIERVLRAHPRTYQTEMVVRFMRFGSSSLDIEIQAWYDVNDFNAFRIWRQDMLLEIMGVVEAAGSAFAFPTQTLHVASAPGSQPSAR